MERIIGIPRLAGETMLRLRVAVGRGVYLALVEAWLREIGGLRGLRVVEQGGAVRLMTRLTLPFLPIGMDARDSISAASLSSLFSLRHSSGGDGEYRL